MLFFLRLECLYIVTLHQVILKCNHLKYEESLFCLENRLYLLHMKVLFILEVVDDDQ